MSEIEVKIVKVNVKPHFNADRLEVVNIGGQGGYECVVGLGEFQNNDLAIYIPMGSVVPQNIRDYLAKTKINVKNGRIRCASIRGVFSEGLCLKPSEWLEKKDIYEDNDVTKLLGITKYEPPLPRFQSDLKTSGVNTGYVNDNFYFYNCVKHFKKYPNVIQPGEPVVITAKFHGTNWGAGLVKRPRTKRSLWKRVKNFFFPESPMEFLVSSHSKIRKLSKRALQNEKYKEDTYWKVTLKYDIERIVNIYSQQLAANYDGVPPEVTIYGEIVGKIQKGYNYGVAPGDFEIRVFDLRINKKFQNWTVVRDFCLQFNLPIVDVVYEGPWKPELVNLSVAVDEYNGKKFNREGIVIRLREEDRRKCGRVTLKYLNYKYLLDRKNTEYH